MGLFWCCFDVVGFAALFWCCFDVVGFAALFWDDVVVTSTGCSWTMQLLVWLYTPLLVKLRATLGEVTCHS